MDTLIDDPKKPLHRKLMNLILRGGMGRPVTTRPH